MGKSLYTFGFQVLVDDKDIQDFLVASSGSINDMQKPVIKKKLKQKIRGGNLILTIEVTFSDMTKMTFQHKTPFDFAYDLMEMSEEELLYKMQAQGMLPQGYAPVKDEEENETKIGFAIPED